MAVDAADAVGLVDDVADDRLEDVLQGHDADRDSLVAHQREVDLRAPHGEQQVAHLAGGWHHEHAPEELEPGPLVHGLGTALRSSLVGFSIALVGVWVRAQTPVAVQTRPSTARRGRPVELSAVDEAR